jgi:hypothetical protein
MDILVDTWNRHGFLQFLIQFMSATLGNMSLIIDNHCTMRTRASLSHCGFQLLFPPLCQHNRTASMAKRYSPATVKGIVRVGLQVYLVQPISDTHPSVRRLSQIHL